jgi:hypothetical protein
MAGRRRDNRLAPSPAQRQRWRHLPGMAPHPDVVAVERDHWTERPAEYRHVTPEAVEPLRRAAAETLLTVWTVDPTAPREGQVHLNRYTMTVAQALELIAGAARGRWIEEVVYLSPYPSPQRQGDPGLPGSGVGHDPAPPV